MATQNRLGVLAIVLAGMPIVAFAQTPGATSIYAFGTSGSTDAINPSTGLVPDSAGNLYGPTSAGGGSTVGAIFELTPPPGGSGTWTETVIHSFPDGVDDGVRPEGRLLIGSTGDLYGTTNGGGGSKGDGTVFQLAPPVDGGGWTLTTLHVFPQNKVGIGASPTSGLIMDSSGALYGASPEVGATKVKNVVAGTVYELMPPPGGQAKWSFATLYSFPVAKGHVASPVSALVADASGNLYGTEQVGSTGGGAAAAIYELTPPAGGNGPWTETSFKFPASYGVPVGDLTIGSDGSLYGATASVPNGNDGVVYRLTPPASAGATLTALYVFASSSNMSPVSGVAFGSSGQLYGNASGGSGKNAAGVTYQLTPPTGSGRWMLTRLVQFASKPRTDGQDPVGIPTVASTGTIYGVTTIGGAYAGGTAFMISP